jgi:periodic tryptophan protein 1
VKQKLNPNVLCQENDDDDEEEIEDLTIKPTDAIILCARNEDEVNLLDVCTIL